MVSTLEYIASKFELDLGRPSPIEIYKINRVIMAQTLSELGCKVGAEIGVQRGIHAEILCKNNPGLHLYCVDVWEPTWVLEENAEQNAAYYAEAQQRLSPYNCTFIKKYSQDALSDFRDCSLDFVYIDAGHDFYDVAMDISGWQEKIKPGGILFGHDYKRHVTPIFHHSVVDVISAYTNAYHIKPWFILGTRGRSDGMYREGTRAWMWVVN